MQRSLLIALFFVLMPPLAAQGQHLVVGTVSDARTGMTLPSATVQIEGTYQGTITNAEGAFSLRVRELPATLLVRFIGYETARVPVAEAPVAGYQDWAELDQAVRHPDRAVAMVPGVQRRGSAVPVARALPSAPRPLRTAR